MNSKFIHTTNFLNDLQISGFWLKNHVFYEQPDVHFKYHYMFIAETDEIENLIICGNLQIPTEQLAISEDCFYFKVQLK